MPPFLRILLLIGLFVSTARAGEFKCYTFEGCGKGGGRSNSSNPSTSNQVRINPSAVPTEKGFGIEGILYDNYVDLSLVRGLGRVGAAISPSNSEETFFGPPAVELDPDYLSRKKNAEKYQGQKITLAAAFDVIERQGSGLNSYALKLGMLARYNKLTKAITPGGGLGAILGPFNVGASIYKDETQLEDNSFGMPLKSTVKYTVQTYNAGIALSSLLLDYSVLRMETEDTHLVSTVRLTTASLLWQKILATASHRVEDSPRPAYNFETQTLETKDIKDEYFGGLQIYATKNLMCGILYNYYLLHEYSLTATLFF